MRKWTSRAATATATLLLGLLVLPGPARGGAVPTGGGLAPPGAAPLAAAQMREVPAGLLPALLAPAPRELGTAGPGAGPAADAGAGPGAGALLKADPLMGKTLVFPFPVWAKYEPLVPNYGAGRNYSGPRRHEGQDIMARRSIPVVAAGSGRIVRYGWNELGGWRLTIQLDAAPGYRLYYAHLDRYAPGLKPGARVWTGHVVGYVGDTGYGPEGTRGKFPPHLHVGLYRPDGSSMDPYPYLKAWEHRRVP